MGLRGALVCVCVCVCVWGGEGEGKWEEWGHTVYTKIMAQV